ncbi:MAG: GNAT family N-acetyltransferase [Hyphomicrobiales bacterium]|nr:MAG: GNAT family N-acetyltransferase [Hyphomicrobiales bacterium]
MDQSIAFVEEAETHIVAREALLDRTMGPIRFRRSSERLREGRLPAPGLALSVMAGSKLVGTVRLWNVRACGLGAGLMLGPLAVDEAWRGAGIAAGLVEMALKSAQADSYDAVILVGDAPYYGRFGFSAHTARRLAMPGPFERHRMLGLALKPGALERAHGTLRPSGAPALPIAAPANQPRFAFEAEQRAINGN